MSTTGSRLKDKVAVITGGSSGIGLASAKAFIQEGARVAIAGRDQKTLDQAAKELGSDALVVRADVSKLADLDRLLGRVKTNLHELTCFSQRGDCLGHAVRPRH